MGKISKEQINHYRNKGFNYLFIIEKDTKDKVTDLAMTPVRVIGKNSAIQHFIARRISEENTKLYPKNKFFLKEFNSDIDELIALDGFGIKFRLEKPDNVLS
jgi:hypothetical protein